MPKTTYESYEDYIATRDADVIEALGTTTGWRANYEKYKAFREINANGDEVFNLSHFLYVNGYLTFHADPTLPYDFATDRALVDAYVATNPDWKQASQLASHPHGDLRQFVSRAGDDENGTQLGATILKHANCKGTTINRNMLGLADWSDILADDVSISSITCSNAAFNQLLSPSLQMTNSNFMLVYFRNNKTEFANSSKYADTLFYSSYFINFQFPATLDNVTFQHGCEFADVSFDDVTFINVKMAVNGTPNNIGTSFVRAKGSICFLDEGAALIKANFTDANLTFSGSLANVNLTGAIFDGATINGKTKFAEIIQELEALGYDNKKYPIAGRFAPVPAMPMRVEDRPIPAQTASTNFCTPQDTMSVMTGWGLGLATLFCLPTTSVSIPLALCVTATATRASGHLMPSPPSSSVQVSRPSPSALFMPVDRSQDKDLTVIKPSGAPPMFM